MLFAGTLIGKHFLAAPSSDFGENPKQPRYAAGQPILTGPTIAGQIYGWYELDGLLNVSVRPEGATRNQWVTMMPGTLQMDTPDFGYITFSNRVWSYRGAIPESKKGLFDKVK